MSLLHEKWEHSLAYLQLYMMLESSNNPESSLSDLYNTGKIHVIAEEAFGLY